MFLPVLTNIDQAKSLDGLFRVMASAGFPVLTYALARSSLQNELTSVFTRGNSAAHDYRRRVSPALNRHDLGESDGLIGLGEPWINPVFSLGMWLSGAPERKSAPGLGR